MNLLKKVMKLNSLHYKTLVLKKMMKNLLEKMKNVFDAFSVDFGLADFDNNNMLSILHGTCWALCCYPFCPSLTHSVCL